MPLPTPATVEMMEAEQKRGEELLASIFGDPKNPYQRAQEKFIKLAERQLPKEKHLLIEKYVWLSNFICNSHDTLNLELFGIENIRTSTDIERDALHQMFRLWTDVFEESKLLEKEHGHYFDTFKPTRRLI